MFTAQTCHIQRNVFKTRRYFVLFYCVQVCVLLGKKDTPLTPWNFGTPHSKILPTFGTSLCDTCTKAVRYPDISLCTVSPCKADLCNLFTNVSRVRHKAQNHILSYKGRISLLQYHKTRLTWDKCRILSRNQGAYLKLVFCCRLPSSFSTFICKHPVSFYLH
jgi:hypothetical protein